jgi:hypothetical protein
MTWQGGGGGSIPGVTPDGLTPAGITVAGALTAGDPAAVSVPSFIQFNGAVNIADTPANQLDGDDLLDVVMGAALVGNNPNYAARFARQGTLNGYQYTEAIILVDDTTATTAPIMQWRKQNVPQLQVDGDGIQVHGKLKSGAIVAHACVALNGNALPLYDESGTLAGYLPLYT